MNINNKGNKSKGSIIQFNMTIFFLFLLIILIIICASSVNAENGSRAPKTIWGYVTYYNGEPIVGASVVVSAEGYPSKSYISDADGAYQVDVGPDTGDPWPDGTSFIVTAEKNDFVGNNNGTVYGSITRADVMILINATVTIILDENWNLVSIPVNQTLLKNDIIVDVGGVTYTWLEAVANGFLLDFIYGWDKNAQSYIISEEFNPSRGYWIYIYEACIFSIGPGANEDLITDIFIQWDLVGLTFDKEISKQNLTLFLISNGSFYTWSEAVSYSFILDFIYGWDVSTQSYILVNDLLPGNSYWFYSYETLKLSYRKNY
ncbi:MAG: carboxypeptidase-like regulatory domain-containing protein [Candidatus Thermoplasmatota archaeon]|nr:carboxypeptidase-like regulatory domain-containing protein [Candidatus Thermoplasmatota archaeon]